MLYISLHTKVLDLILVYWYINILTIVLQNLKTNKNLLSTINIHWVLKIKSAPRLLHQESATRAGMYMIMPLIILDNITWL